MCAISIVICLLFALFGVPSRASDIPADRPLLPSAVESQPRSDYYWDSVPVGGTAQLLTLFCKACRASKTESSDAPLVSVLRDTLGDSDTRNDRVSYVWLLGYSHPNLGRKILSAVPFFYWRVGKGSNLVSERDTAPLLDLTQPRHPVLSEVGRNILQWTFFDGTVTPLRATSRAYRSNELDHERLYLEEAVSYLRAAPASGDRSSLTQTQLDTAIARLELRKQLLGGLVSDSGAVRLGEHSGFEQERIRSRNWELLRQCAEKTGLLFEPLNLAGVSGEYAMLWYPLERAAASTGISLGPVWKLLSLQDPSKDDPAKLAKLPAFFRSVDDRGALLSATSPSDRQIRLVPLGVYNLNYPKLPLLVVDFRDRLHQRRHEMAQRTINEITAGVIGISHFTNWYYYVAADLYDFVIERHGGAMDQAARLDSYSQFRARLALDRNLDPRLHRELQSRLDSAAINPLDGVPAREVDAASARYRLLSAQTENDSKLSTRLDHARRAELALFGESNKAQVSQILLHGATLGLYTHRATTDPSNLDTLDRERRFQVDLEFLDSLANAGTPPEVAYDSAKIRASLTELGLLIPQIGIPKLQTRAAAVIGQVKALSQDPDLQADCSRVLLAIDSGTPASPRSSALRIASSSHAVMDPPTMAIAVK